MALGKRPDNITSQAPVVSSVTAGSNLAAGSKASQEVKVTSEVSSSVPKEATESPKKDTSDVKVAQSVAADDKAIHVALHATPSIAPIVPSEKATPVAVPLTKDALSSVVAAGKALDAANDAATDAGKLRDYVDTDMKTQTVVIPSEVDKIEGGTIVSLVVSIVVVVNTLLAMLGHGELSIDSNTAYVVASAIALVLSYGYAFWKNHDITRKARLKAKVLKQIKLEPASDSLKHAKN